MLLAHCRGLLAPDYKYGLQSMAREKLILHALDCETEAKSITDIIGNQATWYAPHIDIKKGKEYIRNTERLMRYVAEKRVLSNQSYDSMFGATSIGVQGMIEQYKLAEKSGLIEKFKKYVEELRRQQ